MKIDTKLNQIEATGSRAMKYVRYFSRNFMTDRLIIILLVLVGLAIVAVIIVAALGNDNNVVVVRKIKL